jgi:2,5-dioxopentanoate dehydrogenase
MLREGSWLDARIDTADANRTPVPKPDVRSMHMGLGPVAVFAASNFPLAFSVAGGDTAAALAAGCPVIVKAHSAHPATSEIIGTCIMKAAQKTQMPDGVFSMLHGDGTVVGRDVPIPVYAEMGSTNPVFVLPNAMRENKAKIASGFAASVTLGVGQFCTNPGLLLFPQSDDSSAFVNILTEEFSKTSGGAMLTSGIHQSYSHGVAHHTTHEHVNVLAKGTEESSNNWANPVLFMTSGDALNSDPVLAEEIFGPASVVVKITSKEQLLEAARNLSGHLTATVHGTNEDFIEYKELFEILEQKVGRVVVNAFPTGVEVCHAMVHGGPYPATMDGRSTSVGTASIFRFTRAVCFQGWPAFLLPAELQNTNALEILRLVDGVRTRDAIS